MKIISRNAKLLVIIFSTLFSFSEEIKNENNDAKHKPVWHSICMYSTDLILIVNSDSIKYSEPKKILAEIKDQNSNVSYLYKVDIEIKEMLYVSRKTYISGQIVPIGNKIDFEKTRNISCFIQKSTKVNEDNDKLINSTDVRNGKVLVMLSFMPGLCGSSGPDLEFDGVLNISNLDSVNQIIKERINLESKWNGGK